MLLLAVAAIYLLVAAMQLFVASGVDPRHNISSRAAGIGFTDHAHQTLYGVIPLLAPLGAALLSNNYSVRLAAAVQYGLLIGFGLLITALAAGFMADESAQRDTGGVYFYSQDVVELLLLDAAWLALAGVALSITVRALRQRVSDRSGHTLSA